MKQLGFSKIDSPCNPEKSYHNFLQVQAYFFLYLFMLFRQHFHFFYWQSALFLNHSIVPNLFFFLVLCIQIELGGGGIN